MADTAVTAGLPKRGPLTLHRGAAVQWGLALLTVVLVIAPIVPVAFQSFVVGPLYDREWSLTLANYGELFASPVLGELAFNTLVFSAVTTLVAQVVGAVTAILVGRTDIPMRSVLGDVLMWPLFVSHLVLAFGWFLAYGPAGYGTMAFTALTGVEDAWSLYTLAGMGLVAGIAQAPLAFLYCLSATNSANPSLEDAARISGAGPMRTLWSVTIPLIRPAILFSAILNFTIAIEMLAIPLLFGGPTGLNMFTTYLYVEGILAPQPNYGLVGAAAVLLLVVVTGLVWLQGRLLREAGRFVTVRGKAVAPRRFPLGPFKWPFFALLVAYVILAILIPTGGLILRAVTSFVSPFIPPWELLTLEHFELIFSYPAFRRSIVNTVLIAAIGGAIATAYVVGIALVTHRSDFRYRRALEFLALYPRAIPGIIVGIGFFYAAIIIPPMGWLRNTIWILILAFTMRYIPTGFGAIVPSLFQLDRDLDRSARTVGADWLTTSRVILLQLLKPAVFSCYALLFIHFFKEYVAAVYLFAPGSEVIGTTMLTFWVQGDTGPVSALACIQVAITVVFITIARKTMGVKIYG
ncbi:ABC transporter permease [Acuticoccus sp.]|uniref:ABC transporter permease n=1 Tax=Acuticoccus sp. TaxID=1904378 RepID=UPI003B517E43